MNAARLPSGDSTGCARTAGSAARRAARAPTPAGLPAFRRRRNRGGTALGVVRSADDAPLAGRIDEHCRGPVADVARYQNLPSGSHVGCTVNPNTSGVVAGARNFSARA